MALLAVLVGAQPALAYTDVAQTHPYAVAIADLSDRGIVAGYAGDTFRPDNPLFRAQFAKMICGAMGLVVTEATPYPFNDLGPDTASLYPHEYVGAAAQENIILGWADETFRPYLNVTRAAVVTMVVRAARNLHPGLLDAPPNGYLGTLGTFDPTHGPNMAWAEYNQLLEGVVGYGKGWDPWASMSRGETAQVLYNLLRSINSDPPQPDHAVTIDPSCSACHQSDLTAEHSRDGNSAAADGCSACHPLPAGFVWTGKCDDCHRAGGLAPVMHSATDSPHDSTQTDCVRSGCHPASVSTIHLGVGSCTLCHSAVKSPAGTDCYLCHAAGSGDHVAIHDPDGALQSAYAGCASAGCHALNLVSEHVTGQGLACDTCHGASAPVMTKMAIAAFQTTGLKQGCDVCHGQSAGDHASVHASTAGQDCGACHELNLVDEHLTRTGLTCATCHQSTDTTVTDAIAAGDTDCGACHDVAAAAHTSTKSGGYWPYDPKTQVFIGSGVVQASPTISPHAGYSTTTGKCKVCHAVHAAGMTDEAGTALLPSEDLLRSTDANACTFCHLTGGTFAMDPYFDPTDPVNTSIANYYSNDSAPPTGTTKWNLNGVSDSSAGRSGHSATHGHDNPQGVAAQFKSYKGCVSCHAVHGANTMGQGEFILKNDPAKGVTAAVGSGWGGGTGYGSKQAPTTTQIEFCEDCHDGTKLVASDGAVTPIVSQADFDTYFPSCGSNDASGAVCHNSVQNSITQSVAQFGAFANYSHDGRSHIMTQELDDIAGSVTSIGAEGLTRRQQQLRHLPQREEVQRRPWASPRATPSRTTPPPTSSSRATSTSPIATVPA